MDDDGSFQFEDCLLKHYVRKHGWLPLCKQRLATVRKQQSPKKPRRLRYFTFCAIGAIDVLMLDVEKVISQSDAGRFDTVFFFDQTRELVDETTKRIPGAIGFPGEFVDIVLVSDQEGASAHAALAAPEDSSDDAKTRRQQIILATRDEFIQCFPFDVINLDLERHLFWPTEQLPGRLVNAMRRVFEWQRNTHVDGKRRISINEFTLLFTTRIGPNNLNDDYMEMLRNYLAQNMQGDAELPDMLQKRKGTADLETLEQSDFPAFFKIAVPKAIASMLDEEDWYVDEDIGIKIYEFERDSNKGPYKMLHMAMHVKRKQPQKGQRPPGQPSAIAVQAYKNVVRKIFSEPEIVVSENTINKEEIQADFDKIKARRELYYGED